MKQVLLFFVFFALNANAFIPPLSSVLKEIYDSRKWQDGVEIVFNHQVLTADGGWAEIEEKILADRKGIKFLWKPLSASVFVSGQWDKRTYFLGNEKKIVGRSQLFLKNYISGSALEFRDALINEKFLRWEQLKQFKDGFELQGDPQTWDIKNNYLQQDSISLVLLPSGPSIAVVGLSEPTSKRVIYFDKGLLGIRKIEWMDGNENLSWNFDSFTMSLKDSYFPKRASLVKDGREIIQTELGTVRALNKKQNGEWLQAWQKASKTILNNPSAEEALRNLLSHR